MRSSTGLSGLKREQRTAAEEVVQLAAFTVGDQRYALDIMQIKEIINPLPITPVPKSPPFVEGVVELRGAILPVLDLRKRFDLAPTPADRATKYLIVGMEAGAQKWIVGLIVDGVQEVIRVPKSDIRPAPAMAQGEEVRYFSGVCHHRGQIVMVLDLPALLSAGEKASLERMGGG